MVVTSTILGEGPIYRIAREGALAQCSIVNSAEVTAAVGARCAIEMRDLLTARVLTHGAEYRGLVFDVRLGPLAFGPRTRAALEPIFAAARMSDRRIAVVVNESPTQLMQFTTLGREFAPKQAQVFRDPDAARAWVLER